MALSSRDVMFALRAQDFATRRINAVGGAFNRLGRMVEASQKRMDTATQAVNKNLQSQLRPLNEANDALRRRTEMMNRQIQGYKSANAARTREIASIRSRSAAAIDGLRGQAAAERTHMQAAQAANRAIRNELAATQAARRASLVPLREQSQQYGRQIAQARQQSRAVQAQSQQVVDGLRAQNLEFRRNIRLQEDKIGRVGPNAEAQARRNIAAGRRAIALNKEQIEQERLHANERARADQRHIAGLQSRNRNTQQQMQRVQRLINLERTAAAAKTAENDRAIAQHRQMAQQYARSIEQERAVTGARARELAAINRRNEAVMAGLKRGIDRRNVEIAQNQQQARVYEAAAQRQVAAIQRVEQAEQARLARMQMASQRMMMGGAAATIGGMITAAIGGAVIRKLNQATRAAAEFQHGIALARTQIDEMGKAAGATVQDLSRLVMRVGRQVPAAMEEMPQTLFFIFTALNASVPEAEKLLAGFAREAVAGNASVEASARSTIAILNGMNMSVDELTRIQDFQFQTVRKGVITYEQLSANIGKVIPPLRRMGQEVEVGGAMLAFLTRQGLSAEMAATAAARSLELFSDPRVIQRLEDQGVRMRNNAGEFEHFGIIINDLAKKFDGLTGPERAEAMREIFGGAGFRIQARRFLDTVFASEESLAHFNEQIKWAENNTGAFARAFNNMSKEPHVRLQELSNQFFTLRHEIGVGMLPILENLVDKFRQVADWLANIDEDTRSNVVQWAAYGAAMLLVVGGLTALAGLLVTIAGMLTMLTASVKIAVGITVGFIPVVTALGVAFGLILMHGFSLSAILETLGLNFETNAGQAKVLAVGLGLVTASLILAKVAGMGYFAMIGVVIAGMKAKAAAAVALSKALWLIIATNPIIAMFAALTLLSAGLAVAFSRTTREARELQAATDRQTDAHSDQIDTISSSIEGFESYRRHMADAAKAAAEQTLAERDLEGALNRSRITRHEYLEGVAGTSEQHERVREALEREVEQLRENSGWWARANAGAIIEIGTNSKRISQSEELLEAFNLEIAARKTAEQTMRDEMRARGGLSGEIALYKDNLESAGHPQRRSTEELRDNIIATLDAQGVLAQMSDEQVEALYNSENLAEAVDELTSSYASLGAELASVLSQIRDPATALSDALEKINEAGAAAAEGTDVAFESFESLIEASGGAAQAAGNWLDALREQEKETVKLFGNMSEVYDKHEDSILRNADSSIEAILALGEAGPEAMEILASASPEEFVEILHHLRTQAALASEDVQKHIGLMFNQIKGMQDDYQNVSEQQWSDIMMAMSVIISERGEEAVEHMPRLLAMMANFIEEGGDLNAAEIANMMEDFYDVIDGGAGKILDYWPGVHDELSQILNDKGIENAEVFEGVMDALETIAEKGGEDAVEALRKKLEEGTGGIARVARAYADILAGNLNAILSTLGEPTIVIEGHLPGQYHNKGGKVAGSGPDRDSVVAALTPGEFVLRRKAVDKLDLHALHQLNRTGDPSTLMGAYNAGGWVTSDELPKPPSSGAYRPRVNPLIDPAQATTKRMYEESRDWIDKQIPPLSEGVGWQAMWQAVNKVFGGRVNLHSAYRPGAITATGNPSYHGMGRAIDITPDMGIFNWIKSNYGNSREIIFSPAGGGQVHNGRNHMYTGVTRAMHWDHIHWAMANGGMGRVNEPTWFLAGESGPEDFAFAPAGGSRKIGDGPGIGANMDVLNDFMRRTTFQNATPFRMEGIQTIQSAFSALASYEEAQQALKDAYKEVDRLGKRSVQIASEIEQKELQLSQLAKNRVATAQEELNILQAQRRVRDAQWDLGAAKRGVHELNNELAILRQEMRIEEMREGFSGVNQEVIDLTEEVKNLRTEAKEAEKALEEAWKRASQVSIEQERNIINAGRAVREAKNDLEFLQQGLGSMSNELQELQQEIRVEDLREALAELQRGASETELQELADNVQRAADDLDKAQATYAEHAATLAQTQAEVTRRRFELAAVMEIAPNLKRETDRLLAQYRAEAKLADAQKEHAEAQEQYTESAEAVSSLRKQLIENENALTEARNRGSASARELRIAEIELALAERELLERQRARRFESEDLRLAEIALTMAEEGLTEAIHDSTAATNEVIEAQRELDRVQEQLAATSKSLEEAKKSLERGTGELRIAEIELALAEEELLRLHEVRKHEGEALKEAQWNLTVAQEGLTEAVEASKAPTQEMIDLEQQLHDLYQEQKDNAAAQIEARKNITNAELEAINATVGLIKAGQELAKLTPSQLSFFNSVAKQAGVATNSINTLNKAIGTLSGAGVQDPRTRLQKEIQDLFAKYKVPLTYGTSESGSARVKRLADEILMGKRSMSDLERSVQIMAAQMQGISLKAVQAGMYDSGGVLRPGTTIATNNTGQNEFVFTADQLKDLGGGGKTVIVKIDEGSVQINVDGNVTEDALPELEEKIGKAFDEFKDDLYHTLSRY